MDYYARVILLVLVLTQLMTQPSESAAPARRPRRKRDPEGTREAILEAAREVLAQDGKEGVSVAQVAQRAGVNRGTAYQHFQTREQLIEATAISVSEKLYQAVFGDPEEADDRPVGSVSIEELTDHLATFAMENTDLCRVWLFELLGSKRPDHDPFWQKFLSNFERFAKTDLAQPGIDSEVACVMTLAGAFLWPVWARAHSRTSKDRQNMAKRLSHEMLRMSLHGTLRPEKYPALDSKVRKDTPPRRNSG
jgi:AcrR family transcriptional regulator